MTARPVVLSNIAAFITGALLSFAFEPYHIWIIAFLAPAVLFVLWQNKTPANVAIIGISFGAGFFSFGVYWVFISIHVHGHTNILLALLLTVLMMLVLALFVAAQGILYKYLSSKDTLPAMWLGFPGTWAFMEWVRSWAFTGFPWLFLGTTQLNGPLHGFIPVVGVYGTTFVTVLVSMVLLTACRTKHGLISVVMLLSVILLSFALNQIQWTQAVSKPESIALIQGNIAQKLKWEPDEVLDTIDTYEQLTRQHWPNNDIIVWPEAAIPAFASQIPGFLQSMSLKGKQTDTTWLTGILTKDDDRYYNSLLVLGADGNQQYSKEHLVPFGEYVPFESWLRGLIDFFNLPLSTMSAASTSQPPLSIQGIKVTPFICYEIAFPQLARNHALNAQALLTVTDDAWFGRSIAQPQHLAIARMRSLETGRQGAFASNNGITAIIDEQGTIKHKIPPFQKGVLTGKIQPRNGQTPILFLGHYPIIVLITLSIALACLWRRY